MATVAENAVCTAKWTADSTVTTSCKTAGSCCVGVSLSSGGAAESNSNLLCVVQGALTTVSITLTADEQTKAGTGITAVTVYPATACPAYTAGASTLAVSAAALATAVYMM